MSWTKGEIIQDAFTEMGIASFSFDTGPEEQSSALRRLDAMMGEWNSRGLRLSYPLPNTADGSSLDEDSNLPDYALRAVIINLAIELAPGYGKTLSNQTLTNARKALTILYSRSAQPAEQQFNQMPKGAGYKHTEWRWTRYPSDKLVAGNDSELDFEGALNVDNY